MPTIRTFDKLENVLNQFIEPPSTEYIEDAKEKLYSLNLINKSSEINKLGEFISEIPLEPDGAICALTGWLLECYKEVLLILTFAETIKNNIDDIFTFNKNEKDVNKIKKYANIKKSFFKKNSDHYSLLKIFTHYQKLKKSNNEYKWLKEHYLKQNILDKVNKYYKKAFHNVKHKINKYYETNKIENNNLSELNKLSLKNRILLSLAKGYNMNISKMSKRGYKTNKINVVTISKDSWLIGTESKVILYSDLLTINNKSYMQIISKISRKYVKYANNISVI